MVCTPGGERVSQYALQRELVVDYASFPPLLSNFRHKIKHHSGASTPLGRRKLSFNYGLPLHHLHNLGVAGQRLGLVGFLFGNAGGDGLRGSLRGTTITLWRA